MSFKETEHKFDFGETSLKITEHPHYNHIMVDANIQIKFNYVDWITRSLPDSDTDKLGIKTDDGTTLWIIGQPGWLSELEKNIRSLSEKAKDHE